jgi:hypothetical protein
LDGFEQCLLVERLVQEIHSTSVNGLFSVVLESFGPEAKGANEETDASSSTDTWFPTVTAPTICQRCEQFGEQIAQL